MPKLFSYWRKNILILLDRHATPIMTEKQMCGRLEMEGNIASLELILSWF